MHKDSMQRVKSGQRKPRGNSRPPKLDGRAAPGDEVKKRLHAHIPASLHKKLKLKAVAEDRDMTELVVEALTDYLEN